jgi:hypothetical protein
MNDEMLLPLVDDVEDGDMLLGPAALPEIGVNKGEGEGELQLMDEELDMSSCWRPAQSSPAVSDDDGESIILAPSALFAGLPSSIICICKDSGGTVW